MPQHSISGSLFPLSELPEGFSYVPDFLSEQEEADLLNAIGKLDFQAFDFQGYTAKRRVVEYGLEYDFSTRKATTTQGFPEFLNSIRERAAQFAGLAPERLVEGIITEYPPGAPIGWHRDAPQFGTVIGISLASACRMRFKPYERAGKKQVGEGRQRKRPLSIELEPRSIYVIRGPARWSWQHSIPPLQKLRYSITFRTLRGEESSEAA
ncbi:MAG TPA: alpha-ketoglutarate-dependent dioxygenase AlkB [Candidatus Angelobacter sp.]|nr:alpha-ketoglutarate-dependent dioxygenase AlkB [Candidatus Angelobacter sp.]